ncbi:uncharacterized protein G2W53_001962 [Senna tora]|uniref:TIR domain-containing protein n=1 Tax=Senna tora TaxID=362788 RepID=A0A835CN12_9FABA|nr:uncharacterized protein G2W53_001962 [Senna tora]
MSSIDSSSSSSSSKVKDIYDVLLIFSKHVGLQLPLIRSLSFSLRHAAVRTFVTDDSERFISNIFSTKSFRIVIVVFTPKFSRDWVVKTRSIHESVNWSAVLREATSLPGWEVSTSTSSSR